MWGADDYETFQAWYDTDHWWGCYYSIGTGRNVPLKSYPYALLYSPSYPTNYKEFGQNKVCGWDLNLMANTN